MKATINYKQYSDVIIKDNRFNVSFDMGKIETLHSSGYAWQKNKQISLTKVLYHIAEHTKIISFYHFTLVNKKCFVGSN